MKSVVRWDPFRVEAGLPDLASWDPFEDSAFELLPAFFRPLTRGMARGAIGWGPRMDVAETDSAYQMAVELPGVKKEAIQVSVYDNSVTIEAEVPEEKVAAEEPKWLHRERGIGKFSRTIALPEAVDEGTSEAKYVDGVLYLTLHKKRAGETKRLAVH